MTQRTFKLNGLKAFQDKISKLPDHVHDRAATRATAKAADHLRREVKKNVPLAKQGSYAAVFKGKKITRKRGDLADALILKRLPDGESGDFASQHKVVFRRNAATQGIGYIAHFLEGGTQAHEIKQKYRVIQHKGTTGSRFFARTLRQNRKKMNEIMNQEIMKAVQEHFK